MLTKFWESLGEGLSEKWLNLLGPSLIFWAGGLLLATGWDKIEILSKEVLSFTVVQQGILIFGLLILLLGCAGLLQQMSYPILRLLEGYWSFPFFWLRLLLIKWRGRMINRWEMQWQSFAQKGSKAGLAIIEANRFTELERILHYVPSNPADYMPTLLGNILKMAETQPRHKYGLDAVICWPRLWPLLSTNLREEIGQSRKTLNQGVELWTWGMLFLLWSYWSWWAIPIGLTWAWIAYRMAVNAAISYADLVEAAFDTQRWDLYNALHFKLPSSTAEEIKLGEQITEHLWRGTLSANVEFVHPKT